MSGVERVFPGARAGTECIDLGSIKRKGCQVRGESKEGLQPPGSLVHLLAYPCALSWTSSKPQKLTYLASQRSPFFLV